MPRDYDKPKRSWREIDSNKDRSNHRQADKPKMNPKKQALANSASKTYKAKLDAFFDGEGKAPGHVIAQMESMESSSKSGKERTKALKAIVEATTSSAVNKAVAVFLKKWEFPPDFDLLGQVLTCSDEQYMEMAMKMLDEMFAENRVPKRTELLEQRLRRVKTLADDPDLQDKADYLLKKFR
jgi:hypothetical protein